MLSFKSIINKALLYALGFTIMFTSCNSDNNTSEVNLMDIASGTSVAFAYSDQKLQDFFIQPNKAYISGYFYFEEDLADDIIFGLDIEWLEGVDNPLHFEGADWMSFVGITRKGILWFPVGSPEIFQGTPNPDQNWEIRDLGFNLSPNNWYKMTIESDFDKREFISVKIEGNGINTTEDISGFLLEYPNFAPFDKPSLTFYTFAIRSKEFAPNNNGGTKVYFDDIEGGIFTGNSFETIFSNGFENQNEILDIPVTLPTIALDNVNENFWYFENDIAKIKISSTYSNNGSKSIECDATLIPK